MVNILVWDAQNLIDRVADRIAGYSGSYRWEQGFFAGYTMAAVPESLIQPKKTSFMKRLGRVGSDTEVAHWKAEVIPTLRPVDAGMRLTHEYAADNISRPYSPWVASTSSVGYLSPNTLQFITTEYIRNSTRYVQWSLLIRVIRIQGQSVTFQWSTANPTGYAEGASIVHQVGEITMTLRLVESELLGELPPYHWIRSTIGANVNLYEVDRAEDDAWNQCFSNLMLNSNNLANVVSLATCWAEVGGAAKKGASLFKKLTNEFGDDAARAAWRSFGKQTTVDSLRAAGRGTSSNWLRYRFEYNTTKSDLEEAADYLERSGINVELVKADWDPTKIAQTLFGDNIVEHSTQRGFASTGLTDVRVTAQFEPHWSGPAYTSATEISKLITKIQWNVKKWGFQPNLYNLWDMVPLSFVGDYIYDLGSKFETLSRNDIGDYFHLSRAVVTKKTVLRTTYSGADVTLTEFIRKCPKQIPRLEVDFSVKDLGSANSSKKARIMRLLDGVSMLGGNL